MSYDQRQESREDAMPVNLLLFRYGEAILAVHGYTDAEQTIIRDNVVFEPVPVDAGAIAASGTLDRKTLEIRVPTTTDIAQKYLSYPPSFPVTLTIFRGHMNDGAAPEWRAIWAGRVLNGKHEGDGSHQCVLLCEPIATSLRRTGLRRHYQYLCPHVLYGKYCKASRSAATFTTVAASFLNNTLTLDAGWAPDDLIDKFTGGVVEWSAPNGNLHIRTILEIQVPGVSGDHTVHMSGPATELTSQAVRLSLGCNHQMDHCADLHFNIHNFGGFPWIPVSNPIGTFVNAYY